MNDRLSENLPDSHMPEKRSNFFFAYRGREIDDLQKDEPIAFLLLSFIARNTKVYDLQYPKWCPVGSAWVKGFRCFGGTNDRTYRTAKKKLQEFGFATFEGMNKGTIAKLSNTDVYDIEYPDGDERRDKRPTRARDERRDERPHALETNIGRELENGVGRSIKEKVLGVQGGGRFAGEEVLGRETKNQLRPDENATKFLKQLPGKLWDKLTQLLDHRNLYEPEREAKKSEYIIKTKDAVMSGMSERDGICAIREDDTEPYLNFLASEGWR